LCDLDWGLRVSERRNAGKPLTDTKRNWTSTRITFALEKRILFSLEVFRKCAVFQLVEALLNKRERVPGMCPGG
jgi:hypothetical protein